MELLDSSVRKSEINNRIQVFSWLPQIQKDNILILNRNNIDSFVVSTEKYVCIILDQVLNELEKEKECEIWQILDLFRTMLSDDGIIIVMEQNRIGVQVLSGKPYDNGIYFDEALQTDPENRQLSYTKSELQDAFEKSNFEYIKFFYPYPDCRYVKEYFTEGSFDKYQCGKAYYNIFRERVHLYEEQKIWNILIKEKVVENFANGFCVVASNTFQKNIDEIQYIKLNVDRKKEFQIGTILSKDFVYKYPLSKDANAHIASIYNGQQYLLNGRKVMLQGEYLGNFIKYPLIEMENLDKSISNAILQNHKNVIIQLFHDFYSRLFADSELTSQYNTQEFQNVFGKAYNGKKYHCICWANVDLIADNIFCEKDELKIIDGEWVFPFLIPVEFIVWRAINELYSKHPQLIKIIGIEELERNYKICRDDEEVFRNWAEYFAYEYVGSDAIRKDAKNEIDISLKEYAYSYLVSSKILYDKGNGYGETNFINAFLEECFSEVKIQIDISDYCNIQRLKWMPIKNRAFRFILNEISGANIIGHNAFAVEGNQFTFLLGDSYLEMEPNNVKIEMCGKIQFLNTNEQRIIFDYINGKQEVEKLGLKSEINVLKRDLDSVTNSKIWRRTEFIRKFKDKHFPKR